MRGRDYPAPGVRLDERQTLLRLLTFGTTLTMRDACGLLPHKIRTPCR